MDSEGNLFFFGCLYKACRAVYLTSHMTLHYVRRPQSADNLEIYLGKINFTFLLLFQNLVYPAVAWFVSRPSHLEWSSLVFHHRGFPPEWGLVFRSCNCVFPSLEYRRSDLLGDLGQTTGLMFLFPSDSYAAHLHWKLLRAENLSQLLKGLQNIRNYANDILEII